LLNVERTATEREIRKAFKVLALQNHPDKLSSDLPQKERDEKQQLFISLAAAHEILSGLATSDLIIISLMSDFFVQQMK
jgi:DnaJ-class molecular chaperone